MVRTHDIVIPPGTSWLTDGAAQAVCRMIGDAGHSAYFVGGCVRNALLHLPDSDVDMATDALPETVMSLAAAAGFKAVPTGVDHGTVTLVVDDKPFEVTTFRRDVETDGRRAVVAFSTDIHDDARRRDFTMNALYASPQGQVVDPLGGLPDLLARKVRFIEDADARIREDYLRILRFFRFSAWYSDSANGFDPDALAAIAANLDGLETLSAERVGHEMIKLLSAPDPSPAVAVMRETHVLLRILPGADDRWLAAIIHLEGALGVAPDWRCRLAALGGQKAETRLRLSRADARHLEMLRHAAFAGPPLPEVAYRHGRLTAEQTVLLRATASGEMPDPAVLQSIEEASRAVFPIVAADLMPSLEGKALGERLAALEAAWIASGFTLTKAQLLGQP